MPGEKRRHGRTQSLQQTTHEPTNSYPTTDSTRRFSQNFYRLWRWQRRRGRERGVKPVPSSSAIEERERGACRWATTLSSCSYSSTRKIPIKRLSSGKRATLGRQGIKGINRLSASVCAHSNPKEEGEKKSRNKISPSSLTCKKGVATEVACYFAFPFLRAKN